MSLFGNKYGGRVQLGKRVDPVVRGPVRRDTEGPKPTAAKFVPGVGAAQPEKRYTGDAMLGIGTMHKSNAVPVFSSDEAADLARMRRG